MILKKVYLPEPPSIGRTMNVKPRRRKKRKGGGFSWSTYWKTQSLFFLDGTIVDVAGTKYFKDASANGRNFLITDYDFDAAWTVGFPYKSAATISAPAADAALIAADINNFLYDAGGTPNQIPVVSLFQDIDYEHKIFCKHAPQLVVDVAVETAIPGVYEDIEVETYEPRVSHIFMATDALTGDDLAKAVIDFGVPTLVATNVKYVAPGGSDTANGNTIATAYATVGKAYDSVLTNGTVYILTGTHLVDRTSVGRTTIITYDKNVQFISLGNVVLQSTSTNYVWESSRSTVGWTGCTFDGEGDTKALYYHNNAGDNFSTLTRCKATGFTTEYLQQDTGAKNATNTINVIDCVFPDYLPTTVLNNLTIQGSLYHSKITSARDIDYQFNRFIYSTFSNEAIITAQGIIRCNDFNRNGQVYRTNTTNAVDITYNRVIVTVSSAPTVASMFYFTDACVPLIRNNNVSCVVEPSNDITFFTLTAALTPVFTKNIFTETPKDKVWFIMIIGTPGKCVINNNRFIFNNNTDGTMISVGVEGQADGTTSESEYKGNFLRGSKYTYPAEGTGTVHAVFMSGGIDYDIRYNYFGYGGLALAVKTGQTAQSYTKNGIGYNVFEENTTDIWVRGVKDLSIHNNTHSNTTDGVLLGDRIKIDENSAQAGDQFSENVVVSNSIIKNTSTSNVFLVYMDDHAIANGCKVVSCLIWQASAWGHLFGNVGQAFDTIAAAEAAGISEDTVIGDAHLSSALVPATPIVGATLDAAYDDGLATSTSYGNTTTVPVIVTKQQGAAWDCGAYVH